MTAYAASYVPPLHDGGAAFTPTSCETPEVGAMVENITRNW